VSAEPMQRPDSDRTADDALRRVARVMKDEAGRISDDRLAAAALERAARCLLAGLAAEGRAS
jgi:hypothetical protein